MKVISIGTDRKLFEENSAVLSRNIQYASKMDELHIIVFSLKKLDLKAYSIDNLHVYPTNSASRSHYVFDAYRIGKQIIGNPDARSGRGADPGIGFENARNVIISTQDPFETGLVGYFLKKKFNFPLQLQIHTDFLSLYFKNSFLNKIRVRIAKFLIPKADGLRVVSEMVETSIKKYFPNLKIVRDVLPVFVDIEEMVDTKPSADIKVKFPQFKFIILMASRLTREKRIDLGLKAFKKVLSQFSYAGLVIAGDGPLKKDLENLTNKLGLGNNVVFVGWQSDLISFYKTANLFLLTSEYEGYGMSLIEAGACGCPVVTTQVGIAETSLFVNNKNSFVCEVGDTECLSESILKLITDNTKRELFKREMRDSIKSIMITREEYTARYVGLLEKLIKSK